MRTRNGQNVKRCPLIKLSAPNKQEYSYNLLLITITQKQRQDGLEIPLFKMTSQTRPFLKIFLFERHRIFFFFYSYTSSSERLGDSKLYYINPTLQNALEYIN
jgi:hypothetical protein